MIENLTVGVYMDEKLEQAMRTTEPTQCHLFCTLKTSPSFREKTLNNPFTLILERMERKFSLVPVS